MGLFNVTALKHFWRADRTEFVVAIAALLGGTWVWSVTRRSYRRDHFAGTTSAPRFSSATWLSWDASPEHGDSLIWRVIRTTSLSLGRSSSGSNPACFTSTRKHVRDMVAAGFAPRPTPPRKSSFSICLRHRLWTFRPAGYYEHG